MQAKATVEYLCSGGLWAQSAKKLFNKLTGSWSGVGGFMKLKPLKECTQQLLKVSWPSNEQCSGADMRHRHRHRHKFVFNYIHTCYILFHYIFV